MFDQFRQSAALALLSLACVLAVSRPAGAQSGDLSHTQQIWLQEIADDASFKHAQCRYDFATFRQTTLDLLNKEPFTFFNLPGVASLVDVPWLSVRMSVADNAGQCTLAVYYIVCDKKIVTSKTADGSSTMCPSMQLFASFSSGSVPPDRVQSELASMTSELSQDLGEKWRAANPR